jgi:diguanylate cyclase (GGDEF)-like protein/PAS domain S-box-containing protein
MKRLVFQSIVEHASDGIVVVDIDGHVTYCNPAFARLFQRSPQEFAGELFGFPVVAGESTEIGVLRKDGSMGVVEMRVSQTDSDNEPVFIAMLRDISERKRMEQSLRQTKEALTTLHRCAPLGVISMDKDGGVDLWNPAAESIFGWRADEMVGSALATNFSAQLNNTLPDIGEVFRSGEAILGREVRQIKKDGAPVDVSLSLAPVHDEAGRAAGLVCIVEDISRRVRDAEWLRLSGKIFENTQEGIMVTDAQGVILTVNPAFVAVTGYSSEEAVGSKPSLLNSGRHDKAFYDAMWLVLASDGQWHGEIWNRRKNGEIYPEWINMSAIRDSEDMVSHYVAIFSDITTVKQNEERLRTLAHFDNLTGLPNRFLFHDHAELALVQAARSNKLVAILFLDLDHFKVVNDTLGHCAGDTLLIEVAQRLSACLRAGDTLGRVGGDEFNAVLPDLESADAAGSVAGKFIEVLSRPFQIEGRSFHVTTSIGIAIFPQHGQGLDQLSHAADAAMYQVKKHGRNAFRFCEMGASNEVMARRVLRKNHVPYDRQREKQGGAR